MNKIKDFLEQPRRGKMREAQITPHKAIAAVWGLTTETGSDCGISDTDKRNIMWE